MVKALTSDSGYELQEIAEQITDLIEQASDLLRGSDRYEYFRSYIYGHVMSAVAEDNGGYMSHNTSLYDMGSKIANGEYDDDYEDDDE